MGRKKNRSNMMRNNKSRNIIKAILGAGFAFLFFLFISYATDYYGGSLKDPAVIVAIPAGAGTAKVAEVLKESKVIRHTNFFQANSRLKGADGAYLEGEFEVERGMGYNRLVDLLTSPSDYNMISVTIYEGMTVKQIASRLSESGVVEEEAFLAACENGEFNYDFLSKKIRANKLEGYLFPDTYKFLKDTEPQVVIDVMLKRFDDKFTQEYRDRAKEIGKTIGEVVTMASLVEGEALTEEDRPLVAGVFYNRLKSKLSYEQYLQSCASVQYVLGKKKPILSLEDTKIDSLYNTYKYKGLPVGPICCPGERSIKAALWPADTEYRYFQSDNVGKLYFAKTLQEHEKIRVEIQGN